MILTTHVVIDERGISKLSIRKNFTLPSSTGVPSSGDGGPGFDSPVPSDEMESRDALSSHLSQGRGHEDQYRLAQQQATGIKPGGSSGFGLQGDVESGFWTNGTVSADSNEPSTTTTGGTDKLIVNDTLPTDSNQIAGGRPVA